MVNTTFLPDHVGGSELHTLWTSQAMAARGHQVRIVTFAGETADNQPVASAEDVQGIQVLRLRLPSAPRAGDWSVREDLQAWTRGEFRRWKPDVVCFGLFLNLTGIAHAAADDGVPFTVMAHLYSLFCYKHILMHAPGVICDGTATPQKCRACVLRDWSWKQRGAATVLDCLGPVLKRRVVNRLQRSGWGDAIPLLNAMDSLVEAGREQRWLMENAAAVLAPSRFAANLLIRNGVSADRAHVCRHGVPRPSAQDAGDPPAGLKAAGRICFAVISRLSPEKGVDVLIRAVKKISRSRDFLVVIYGGLTAPGVSENVKRLRAMAEGEPRIRFEGAVANEALDDVYRRIDVLVAPSNWHEVLGLTVLEALARKTPVIVSDCGGLPENIETGRMGLVFRGGDADDLARMMLKILDDPGVIGTMRAQIQLPLSIHESADRFEKLLSAVIAR